MKKEPRWKAVLDGCFSDGGLDSSWCKAMKLKYGDPDVITALALTDPEKPPLEFMEMQVRNPGDNGVPAEYWLVRQKKEYTKKQLFRWCWYVYLMGGAHHLSASQTNYMSVLHLLALKPKFRARMITPQVEYYVRKREMLEKERLEREREFRKNFHALASKGVIGELKAYKKYKGWTEEHFASFYPERYAKVLAKREKRERKKKKCTRK
jgi:hypothetical protein